MAKNNNKNGPNIGVDLINPQLAGASAKRKDYLKRKDNLLKDVQMLEVKYNIRLGAELRYTPTGAIVTMVTHDVKGKKVITPPN